jgi:hypothetical protein
MTLSNGLAITAFIINIPKPMPTRIMPPEAFSSPTSVGCWWGSIRTWSEKAKLSIWAICIKIQFWLSREGESPAMHLACVHQSRSGMHRAAAACMHAQKAHAISVKLQNCIFRFYLPLALFFCFIMPTLVPMYFWNESALTAFLTAGIFRYTWLLHCTWTINSIAHIFGNRPYDKSINPRQNLYVSHFCDKHLCKCKVWSLLFSGSLVQFGWRLAQLPSRLPIRLSCIRISVYGQFHHVLHRFLRENRLGSR